MLDSKKLNQYILEQLKYGPRVIVKLIEDIKKARAYTTKQGVYAALRELKKQEAVVTHHKQASLNLKWLNQQSAYFFTARSNYLSDTGAGDFSQLNQGEKIAYYFMKPALTDAFWCHVIYILIERQKLRGPVFLYNPHCWFFVARPESERALRDYMTERRCQYLMTVYGQTPLDRYIKNEFDCSNSQYYMSPRAYFSRSNYYLNVIGDFLIEVWINPVIAQKIENLYQETKAVDGMIVKALSSIINSRGRSRLVISCDKKKAKILSQRLARNFYIRRNSQDHIFR